MKRLFLLLIVALAFACNKNDDPQPSSQNSADITGKVILFGKAGSCDMFSDHAGVKVSLTLNGKVKTIETDSKGYFTFQQIPVGTYEIKYEKENFGTYYQYSIKHLGGAATVLKNMTISEKSTIEYNSVKLSNYNSVSISVAVNSGNTNFSCNSYYFQVYMSDSPEVSSSSYKEMTGMIYTGYPNEAEFTVQLYLTPSSQLKGKKIYLKVYNTPYIDLYGISQSNYFDIYKNQYIYPSVNNGSSVLSTTIY
jgi:hypothetical protein